MRSVAEYSTEYAATGHFISMKQELDLEPDALVLPLFFPRWMHKSFLSEACLCRVKSSESGFEPGL